MRVTASDLSVWFGHEYSILKAETLQGVPASERVRDFLDKYPPLVEALFYLDQNPQLELSDFLREAVGELAKTRLRELEVLAQRMRVKGEWPL